MDFHQVKATTIDYLIKSSTSFLANQYYKLILRINTATQNIWFLNKCLSNNITPKYIKLKTNNKSSSARKAIAAGLRKWIIEDRKIEYNKRDVSYIYLKVVHSELAFRLNSFEFDYLDNKVRSDVRYYTHKKFLRQKRKLRNLQSLTIDEIHQHNNFSDHSFYPRFVNLTAVNFSAQELQLIEKGFKFNIQPIHSKTDFELLGVNCELILNNYNKYFDNLNACSIKSEKYLLANKIQQLSNNCKRSKKRYLQNNIIHSIKQKLIDNKIVFTRADKGNSVIAISEAEYKNKTEVFLCNYKVSNCDPTSSFQNEIDNCIAECSFFDDRDSYLLTNMNPQPPKLYSLVKLHKVDNPIRPVVSYMTAPAYKLAKRMINIISFNTNFDPKFAIKNSLELINRIKDLNIPKNSILLSFDVKNLFPSVPPNEVIELSNNLMIKNKCDSLIREDILKMFKICLKQNYFEFAKKIYIDENSLAMGNPLSPLAAEIFMDNLENEIQKDPIFNKFIFWYRYVDDIFACFTGTERQLNNFHNRINKLHKNITFTLEKEIENSINFLDLTITKINNKCSFKIFHKPTHTDMVIHNTSVHPYAHKLAAFRCYIHRLLNTPLSIEDYNSELNIIKQIAVNNGYQANLIDTMIEKKLLKQALQLVYPRSKEKPKKYYSLMYIGEPSEIIRKHLKFKGINVVFRTDNSLSKYIKNNKSKTEKGQKSGIYELKCGSCEKVYIGQTGRTFDERMSEHFRSYRLNYRKSNYANHTADFDHIFVNDFKILHIEEKGTKMNALESLEINKRKFDNILLNDQTDINSSPLLNMY